VQILAKNLHPATCKLLILLGSNQPKASVTPEAAGSNPVDPATR